MPTETPTAPPEPTTATIEAPPPSEKAPVEFMSDIMSELADMDAGKPVVRDEKGKFAKAAPKPVAKTPAPEPKKPETPPAAPKEETKTEPEKPGEPEAEKPVELPKPVKAAELRNAYDGLKKRVREEYEPELQRLRSRVKEYEARQAEDPAPLLSKIKSLEDKNQELEKHIRFVDYTKSGEYTAKYEQPYADAWTEAVAEFRELTVREPDGVNDEGQPKYRMRPADENDLIRLGSMKLSDMDEAAAKMFGASAPRATNHIQTLRRLSAAKNKALEEARKQTETWQAQQQAQNRVTEEARAKAWAEVNAGLKEKFPKAYAVEEGDPDDQASYNRGFALADLMFQGADALTPEQVESLPAGFRDAVKARKPLTPMQVVQLHALARLKMANHDRKVAALKKAQARIAELETALKEFEASEPSAEKAGEGKTETTPKEWLDEVADELRALDK